MHIASDIHFGSYYDDGFKLAVDSLSGKKKSKEERGLQMQL